MSRVRNRDLGHHPIEDCGALQCSVIRPMPTPSWTVSFTMPTASNSPAKACAGHEANRTRRLDKPPSPVTQIHRPARLATRAASFRYGGRHHSGIPGDIIPLYPGDFVGIRIEFAKSTTNPKLAAVLVERAADFKEKADEKMPAPRS